MILALLKIVLLLDLLEQQLEVTDQRSAFIKYVNGLLFKSIGSWLAVDCTFS